MVVRTTFDRQEYSESKPDESTGFNEHRHSKTFGEDSQFARNKKRHQELSTKFKDKKQIHHESQYQIGRDTHQCNLDHGSQKDEHNSGVKGQRSHRIHRTSKIGDLLRPSKEIQAIIDDPDHHSAEDFAFPADHVGKYQKQPVKYIFD